MRIGFDAKRAFYNFTGLGNYSRNIINSLYHYFGEHEYYLFTPQLENSIDFIHGDHINVLLPETRTGRIFRSYWRSVLLSKQLEHDQIDIYHGLSNELPVNIHNTKIKTVVTIHDLIFLRYPDLYTIFDRNVYNKKFRYAAEHANKIIAVSTQTKSDLIEFYNIDADKINVIYQSCDNIYQKVVQPDEKIKVKEQYRLPDEYLLYVGTIEERKNLLNVVKALHLGNINIPLVIVGKTTPYLQHVVNYICNHLVKNIIFLKEVPLKDLPAIYQSASLFIYPSVFEGFGIPILEAMQSGVPVITSKGGCFEEVGGEAANYVDPNNVEDIINALNTLLIDQNRCSEMKDKGYMQAKKFSEEGIARQIMGIYSDLYKQ